VRLIKHNTGWSVCSGTAKRGYSEAVIEFMTNFFLFLKNFDIFPSEKAICPQYNHLWPPPQPPTSS